MTGNMRSGESGSAVAGDGHAFLGFRDEIRAQLAQEPLLYCYDKMCEQGYFRDSDNDPNLLWKFNLPWWEDIIPRSRRLNFNFVLAKGRPPGPAIIVRRGDARRACRI